jgi:YesN/AraC family two-component response regulator
MASITSPAPFSLLIVEDDLTASKLITRMISLKYPQCTIYRAENGISGIEIFRQFTPDIVLTDVNMPVMDGIEMARAIRAINPDTRYIVLTAYSDKIIFEKFMDIGVCAYLLKPLDFKELLAAIGKCTGEDAECLR